MSCCTVCQTVEAKKWYGKAADEKVCNKCYLKSNRVSSGHQEKRKEKYANDPEYRARTQESVKKTRSRMKENGYVRVRKPKDQMSEHEKALERARRQRYRDNNKEKIKAANVIQHAANYEENKDSIIAKNEAFKRTLIGQYSGLKTSARRRGISFQISLEEYAVFRVEPCNYCDRDLDETGGCLDRLDNSGPYAPYNCVPCCAECNYLRRDLLTVRQTRLAAQALKAYRAGAIFAPIPKCEPCEPPMGAKEYGKLLLTAAKRGIEVTLTREQYWTLVSSTCYYDGAPLPSLSYGLDRLDPKVGYTLANSVPCCALCNALKSDRFTAEEMLVIAEAVANAK